MWSKSSRLKALEDNFAGLAARQYVAEAIFATAVAMVLRSVSAGLRDPIMLGLRASIMVSTSGFSDPDQAETMILEVEERAKQLLDQVERLARQAG